MQGKRTELIFVLVQVMMVAECSCEQKGKREHVCVRVHMQSSVVSFTAADSYKISVHFSVVVRTTMCPNCFYLIDFVF